MTSDVLEANSADVGTQLPMLVIAAATAGRERVVRLHRRGPAAHAVVDREDALGFAGGQPGPRVHDEVVDRIAGRALAPRLAGRRHRLEWTITVLQDRLQPAGVETRNEAVDTLGDVPTSLRAVDVTPAAIRVERPGQIRRVRDVLPTDAGRAHTGEVDARNQRLRRPRRRAPRGRRRRHWRRLDERPALRLKLLAATRSEQEQTRSNAQEGT